ncbi:MAG: DUF6537 domain-containing protein, partial [Armatimonadota bacterium]
LPFGRTRHEKLATWETKSDELTKLPAQAEELRRPALQLRVETSSLTGYLLLKVLHFLKPLRPYSRRFKEEWAAIIEWLNEVKRALDKNYDLAFLVARSGELVRGYGRTRRKTLALWRTFVKFLNALQKRGISVSEIVSSGEQFLALAMSGPDGAEKAWKFAAEKLREKSG